MERPALVAFAITVALLFGAGSRRADRHLVVLLNRVWRVDAQGTIAPFEWKFPKGYRSGIEGSMAPVLSPDGRWIAYGDPADHDIHLLEVRTLHQRRITSLGSPSTLKSVSVDGLVAGWSPDSRHLLLNVAPGEDTSEEGDLRIPPASYGFREYDIARSILSSVVLPKGFRFVAWLPGRRFLGTLPGPRPCDRRLVAIRPGVVGFTELAAAYPIAVQVKASKDRRFAIGLFAAGPCSDWGRMHMEIAKVDLVTREMIKLGEGQNVADQQPDLSPSLQHFSYTHRTGLVKGVPQENLIVDRQSVYSCPGPLDYRWVDEQMIAVACIRSPFPLAADIALLDTTNRKLLGHYSLKLAPD